jgi:HEPN domain-containing protein
MKQLTEEWIGKAEGDFASAQRELRARKTPNYDSACFHVQQCIEKYLKARICEEGVPIAKTHNLLYLLDHCLACEPMWESVRTSLNVINLYAVAFRYPGEHADKSNAREAVALCKGVREMVRHSLGMAKT